MKAYIHSTQYPTLYKMSDGSYNFFLSTRSNGSVWDVVVLDKDVFNTDLYESKTYEYFFESDNSVSREKPGSSARNKKKL
jgi:hypothetical protein